MGVVEGGARMSRHRNTGRPKDHERGKIRPLKGELWPHEIEPGRSVVSDWDRELRETWDERKARQKRERADNPQVRPQESATTDPAS